MQDPGTTPSDGSGDDGWLRETRERHYVAVLQAGDAVVTPAGDQASDVAAVERLQRAASGARLVASDAADRAVVAVLAAAARFVQVARANAAGSHARTEAETTLRTHLDQARNAMRVDLRIP